MKILKMEGATVIKLDGDPKNPEKPEHRIEFPGGSIYVTRTTDNKYWAHIEIVKQDAHKINGRFDHSRLDYEFPMNMREVKDLDALKHIAVKIEPFTP